MIEPIKGKLIICPTPIGNLGDASKRMLEALQTADVVCAEDTRITGKLLAAFDIRNRLERLDEAALSRQLPIIIARLREGETIAYCSDAGMPGISDPGQRLIHAARQEGIPVDVLPGPSAAITAYVASGFTCPQFYFGGFFPRKPKSQTELLSQLGSLEAVLLFYESPKRLMASLESLEQHLPMRQAAVCRELTKLHQEVVVGSIDDVITAFSERCRSGTLKGEIVLVIDAPSKIEYSQKEIEAECFAEQLALQLKQQGNMTNKDIIATLQKECGISRNSAYKIVVD